MARNLPGRLSRQQGRADTAFVLSVVSRRKGNKAKGKLLKSKNAMAHCVMVAATVGATGCQVGGANFANRVDLPPGAFVNTATTAEAKPDADAVPAETAAHEGLVAATPAITGSTGTTPASAPDWPGALIGARNLAVLPRLNPYADDLLDHWGHRQIDGIRARAGREPNGGTAGTLQSVRAADRATTDREIVVPQLAGGDTVEVLGERLGVHTGRWSGGPADTLSIEFNYDHAGEAIRENRAFRAIVDRAGKAWSHRIADTWSTWHRPEGRLKTYFLPNGDVSDEIRVESGGETSTGLEIVVTALDAAESGGKPSQALIGIGGVRATTKWEPHNGAIRIIREPTSDFGTFFTAVHEIGHVIGAWYYIGGAAHFAPYADLEQGTWHGPAVLAVHGRPAPFQDKDDPFTSVGGERSANATTFDFVHAGVCVSVMAYCGGEDDWPLPLLPHAIDYAFLADSGMTILAPQVRPETYGIGAWTEHAGATVSVARTLHLDTFHSAFDGSAFDRLDPSTIDLLEAQVDAFGRLSTGSAAGSHGLGTARFSGQLLGTALERPGLPPVIGYANLALDLGQLAGDAYFSALEVYEHGRATRFGTGALHYPLDVTGNTLSTTRPGVRLRADFYGPRHEDIAGSLHDPFAGLLASFATATDPRPGLESTLLAADAALGRTYRSQAADPAQNGYADHECTPHAGCRSRSGSIPRYVGDWTDVTQEEVMREVFGANAAMQTHLVIDTETARIEHASARADSPNGPGRHRIDSRVAAMEHATFGTGIEYYVWWEYDFDDPGALYSWRWTGAAGSASGSAPAGSARWKGTMLGRTNDKRTEVQGSATIDYRYSTDTVDVAFTDIASTDGQTTVDDLTFEGLEASANGRFGLSEDEGSIEVALFGPEQEEAAGVFHHNHCRSTETGPACWLYQLIGAFGGATVAPAPTLEERGFVNYRARSPTTGSHGHERWGVWGSKFGEDIFGAFLAHESTSFFPEQRIEGTPSGTNPTVGTAVWTGETRAYDPSLGAEWFAPVRGKARIEADLENETVDVDLNGFDHGHASVSWTGLGLEAGSFEGSGTGKEVQGQFYGPEHDGVAGTFATQTLKGVFGAMREP